MGGETGVVELTRSSILPPPKQDPCSSPAAEIRRFSLFNSPKTFSLGLLRFSFVFENVGPDPPPSHLPRYIHHAIDAPWRAGRLAFYAFKSHTVWHKQTATMVVEADGGAPVLAAGVSVLLHTVPRSAADIDAEEAVWRHYNSCVDFSFQETRGNARESCSKFKPESRHDRLNWHLRMVKSRGLLLVRVRPLDQIWRTESVTGRMTGPGDMIIVVVLCWGIAVGFMPGSWAFGEDQHILCIFVFA